MNTIKFSKEKAKRIKQTIVNTDGETTSHSIAVNTPSSFHFVRCRGNTLDDLIEADTCKLFDPDGEKVEYLIQSEEEQILSTIAEKGDYKVVRKSLAPMVDCYGTEFLWPVTLSQNGKVNAFCISGRIALESAMRNWVKITWMGKRHWDVRTPSNQEQFGEPQFTKISDEEIINIAYFNRIITDTNHEALRRYQGV